MVSKTSARSVGNLKPRESNAAVRFEVKHSQGEGEISRKNGDAEIFWLYDSIRYGESWRRSFSALSRLWRRGAALQRARRTSNSRSDYWTLSIYRYRKD